MIFLAVEWASAKRARDHVGQIAAGWPVDLDDVRVVASELATNAIRHAKTEVIGVRAYSVGGVYTVEVWDADAANLPVLNEQTAVGDGGRGIAVIAELAAHVGVWCGPEGGKVVYAEWTAS
ncbi:ATP-binding protein [Actinomadura syzygii]|uniref:ATP-binding protein n=1 Tax=Actinomadura syzygii TaxID=1427538 RepID=A0A5D0TR10_9ACTN|nr:ATP-binding protein [Actinomadura syzygii]TYC08244.1 ATP-binding protein [Actinomadura syzygii]